MKLENQVVSLDLSKRLKELGVKSPSNFYWDEGDGIEDRLEYSPNHVFLELIPAYTVAELGEMLPTLTTSWKSALGNWVCEVPPQMNEENIFADTEADARAKMLIYLIENNLLQTNSLK